MKKLWLSIIFMIWGLIAIEGGGGWRLTLSYGMVKVLEGGAKEDKGGGDRVILPFFRAYMKYIDHCMGGV